MIALARSPKPKAKLHTQLERAVHRALGQLPWCEIYPIRRGVDVGRPGARIPYGWLDGCSDLWGWVTLDPAVTGGLVLARPFGVEIKAAGHAEAKNQQAFRRRANAAGCYACVVRARTEGDIATAVAEALAHAEMARAGLNP